MVVERRVVRLGRCQSAAYTYTAINGCKQSLPVCTLPSTISPLPVVGQQLCPLPASQLPTLKSRPATRLGSLLPMVCTAYREELARPTICHIQAQELDEKIQDVVKRINTERKILEASHMLKRATVNPDVLRMNDAKIKETTKSLLYFEGLYKELEARKLQFANGGDDHMRSTNAGLPTSPKQSRHDRDRSLPPTPPTYGDNMRNSAQGADAGAVPKTKAYSNLDLIKADTPHTTAKISKMLHQLEFKLQVEKQYKEGIAKMSSLYQADGDKKSRADAETKKIESDRKILLLQSALKRYKNLHILDDADDDDDQAGR